MPRRGMARGVEALCAAFVAACLAPPDPGAPRESPVVETNERSGARLAGGPADQEEVTEPRGDVPPRGVDAGVDTGVAMGTWRRPPDEAEAPPARAPPAGGAAGGWLKAVTCIFWPANLRCFFAEESCVVAGVFGAIGGGEATRGSRTVQLVSWIAGRFRCVRAPRLLLSTMHECTMLLPLLHMSMHANMMMNNNMLRTRFCLLNHCWIRHSTAARAY